MNRISGRAYAKVNLGLRVLDRRPDGFHELRTIYQTVGLYDRIEIAFRPAEKTAVELRCNVAALESSENLVVKAALRLLERTATTGRVEISLTKRIPTGAGLGGGSSDAAAILAGLNRLLAAPSASRDLFEIAAGLGSDVPFFLLGGKALGVGRGEEVYPLPEGPRSWILLLAPGRGVATPEAYRALAEARCEAASAAERGLTPVRKGPILSMSITGLGAPGDSAAQSRAEVLENDFESVIFRRLPELAELKEHLLQFGAREALMSGSGSTLFGLFENRRAALVARDRIGKFDGKAFVVSTVSRRRSRAGWRIERE